MIVGVEHNEKYGTMVLSYIGQDRNVQFITKKLKESDLFVWHPSTEKTEFIGWDAKTFLKQKKSDRLNRYRLEEIVRSRLTPEEWEMIRAPHKPKASYIDIETMVGPNGEFPEPEQAEYPVIAINVVTEDNQIYQLNTMKPISQEEQQSMLNEANEYVSAHGQKFKMAYMSFTNERDMLACFFHQILPKLSVITGWNVIEFDWLTLVNRAEFHRINVTQNLMSKVLNGRNKTPTHTALLDYIDMMEKFRPLKYVENHKLAYISKRVLGISKMENPYSSFFEFIKHEYEFIKYNIIDTMLVKLIDDKLHMLDSAYGIANTAEVEVSRIVGPVFMTEILMCRLFLEQQKYMWIQREEYGNDEKYEGAFVKEPIPDYYLLIACFDFKSMYPNLQMQFNMSPDAYLGKATEINLTALEPGSFVVTKNNTVFTLKFDSVARRILSNLYNARIDAQNEIDRLKEILRQDDSMAA